jgi:peptidoglycan/LPS O-acetylase OafA/YrhL
LLPVLFLGLCFGNALPKRLLSSRPALVAGDLSYSLYLTHALMSPLILYIVAYCHEKGIAHGQGRGAAVALALTIPISFLLYHYLEKPSRTILRRLFERNTRTEPVAAGIGG